MYVCWNIDYVNSNDWAKADTMEMNGHIQQPNHKKENGKTNRKNNKDSSKLPQAKKHCQRKGFSIQHCSRFPCIVESSRFICTVHTHQQSAQNICFIKKSLPVHANNMK